MFWDKYRVFTMREDAVETAENVTEWSTKGIVIQTIIYGLLLLAVGFLAGYSLARWMA